MYLLKISIFLHCISVLFELNFFKKRKKKKKKNMKEVVSFIASIGGLMHSKQTATTKVQVNVERHALTLN